MITNDFVNELPDLREENANKEKNSQVELKHIKEIVGIKQSIKEVSSVVSDAIARKSNIVRVDNFPKSISTPDVQGLIVEIKVLRDKLLAKETPEDAVSHDLLNRLLTAIQALPTSYPEGKEFPSTISVDNQKDYDKKLDEVIKAVNAIEMNFKPNISVKPADVSVQSDFTLLEDKLDILTKAVRAISIIIPEQDDTELLKRISAVTKAINSLSFPVPNYILPFKALDGHATQVQLTANGKLPVDLTLDTSTLATEATLQKLQGFQIPIYDTQVIDESASPATTIITYKLANITVATKTITVSGSTTTISVV